MQCVMKKVVVRQRYHSSIDSGTFFEKYWQKAYHIREFLTSEISGVAIGKAGKVC